MQERPRDLFESRVFGKLNISDQGDANQQRLRSILDLVLEQHVHMAGAGSPLELPRNRELTGALGSIREYEQRVYGLQARGMTTLTHHLDRTYLVVWRTPAVKGSILR